MIEEDQEFDFDFDILDPTKLWPEEQVPVKIIGKMTLNRNVDNFFAETEQVAFHPGNVVPGIDVSNDPLLQGRLFSYLDTQLIRLGGPNFVELPINRPLADVHNYQRDAHHRMTIGKGKANYWPNSLDGPRPASAEEGGYVHHQQMVDGHKTRARSESFSDHFSQAKMFWNSMSPTEKEHIVNAFHFELGKVEREEVRQRLVDLLENVDVELARNVADGIGVTTRGSAKGNPSTMASPALSMIGRYKPTPKGRKIAILLSDGYSAADVNAMKGALDAAGCTTKVVAKELGECRADDGSTMKVDMNYVSTDSVLFDAVYVPGGAPAVDGLLADGYAKMFVAKAFKHNKPVAASGDGVRVFEASEMPGVEFAGEYDDGVKADQSVFTTRGEASGDGFTDAFIDAIANHRDWTRAQKVLVPA